MDKSKERAWEIIKTYIHAAKDQAFIKAIILVGSLSDDTYTGNAGSDIDLPDLPYLNLLRLCHKNRFSPEEITEEDRITMGEEYQCLFLPRPKTWVD